MRSLVWLVTLSFMSFQLLAEVKDSVIELVKAEDGTTALKLDATRSIQIARKIDMEEEVNVAHEIYFGEIWNRISFDRQDEFVKFNEQLEKGLKWAAIAQEKDVQLNKQLGILNTSGLGSGRNVVMTFVTKGKADIHFEFNFNQKIVLDLAAFKEFQSRVLAAVKFIDKLQNRINKHRDEKEKLEARFQD